MIGRLIKRFGFRGGKRPATACRPLAAFRPDLQPLDDRLQPAVLYYGGGVLPNVETTNVFLGSDWTSPRGQTAARNLDQFATALTAGPYLDVLGQDGYGVGRGSATAGVVDPVVLDPTQTLTDKQIRQELEAVIRGGAAQPDPDRLYILYVAPGVAVRDEHSPDAKPGGYSTSPVIDGGYHGVFTGKNAWHHREKIHYAVLTYPTAVFPAATGSGSAAVFDRLTVTASREVIDAATDPNVHRHQLAWVDPQRGEVGDVAAGDYQFLNGYKVQVAVDRQDHPTPVSGSPVYRPDGVRVAAASIAPPPVTPPSASSALAGPADDEITLWGVRAG